MRRRFDVDRFRAMVLLSLSISLFIVVVAGCTVALPARSSNQSALNGDALHVEDAMARPSPMAAGNGAAYLTIVNPTDTADRLISVESSIAASTELHETIDDNGILRMIPRPEGFAIPAHSTLELKPGAKHIMFVDLVAPLEAGQTFELTLNFERTDSLTVTVPVGTNNGTKMNDETNK